MTANTFKKGDIARIRIMSSEHRPPDHYGAEFTAEYEGGESNYGDEWAYPAAPLDPDAHYYIRHSLVEVLELVKPKPRMSDTPLLLGSSLALRIAFLNDLAARVRELEAKQ